MVFSSSTQETSGNLLHLLLSRRIGRRPAAAMAYRPTLEPVVSKLEKFILYQTHSHMYIVGCDKRQVEYRVLKLDRAIASPNSLADILCHDPCVYSKTELKDMLEMIHEGNRQQGGLQRITTGYGILGFVRFLDCYYLSLVTQRRKVGAVGSNYVYGIKASEMFPIRARYGARRSLDM